MQKSLFVALAFGLVSLASASERVVVTCTNLPFGDLTKVEIRETDLKGRFQIVETIREHPSRKETTRLSPVFGMEQIERSELPELSAWNGYTRHLVRYGRENYGIDVRDECSGSVNYVSCKESF